MGYNKRRNYERQENKTGVLTWRREARRDPEEGHTVSAGPNHGNSGSSPRVYHPGPKVHRNRISRHPEPGYEWHGRRRSLELINQAATSRTTRVVVSYYLLAREQASKLYS
jgi:hypothetical protein